MLTISSDCLSSCFCPDEVAFCRSFDSSWCQECFQSNIKVCVTNWHINQLLKSTMYFLLYTMFYFIVSQRLKRVFKLAPVTRSSLRTGDKVLLHLTSGFFVYSPSISLVKTWTCVTEREAFGLPAVPRSTFSRSHWSAPDALLIWCTWMLRFTWAELRYRHYSQSES